MSQSAFIPFCDFGGNMASMGIKSDHFSVPVCNSFQAKILNDQLCYEVDLHRFVDRNNIKSQLELGLNLILDYNEDRQVTYKSNNDEILIFYDQNASNVMDFSMARTVFESDQNSHAFIYFDTIGRHKCINVFFNFLLRYSKFTQIYFSPFNLLIYYLLYFSKFAEPVQLIGEGEYNLNAIKEIKVTDDFAGIDKDIRECQMDEPLHNCTTRQYINTLEEKCGCLPQNMIIDNKSDKVFF